MTHNDISVRAFAVKTASGMGWAGRACGGILSEATDR